MKSIEFQSSCPPTLSLDLQIGNGKKGCTQGRSIENFLEKPTGPRTSELRRMVVTERFSSFLADSGLGKFPYEAFGASKTGKARDKSPGLPLEARKEDPFYDPSACQDPVDVRPAYGAGSLDP
jgi:hypothetical protein